MKKIENQAFIQGRLQEHTLELRFSEKQKVNYIRGKMVLAIDDEGMTTIPVEYIYAPEKFKNKQTGAEKPNSTFAVLKQIIETGKTVEKYGFDAATIVEVSKAEVNTNDYVDSESKDMNIISYKRFTGGFVSIIPANKLKKDVSERCCYSLDMVITGLRMVEENIDTGMPEHIVLKGGIIPYGGALTPVEFLVKDKAGCEYFESLEPTPASPKLTTLYGTVKCTTVEVKKEEKTAFGKAKVMVSPREFREWLIESASERVYEYGDDLFTEADLKHAIELREQKIAKVKQDYIAWKETQNAPAVATAQGGFGGNTFSAGLTSGSFLL